MSEKLSKELLDLLGEDAFLRLCEKRGGTRLYVSNSDELANELGCEAAAKLHRSYGGSYIRVPIGRKFRVVRYRAQGMSNRKIAVALGITESGVDRIVSQIRQQDPDSLPARRRARADTAGRG